MTKILTQVETGAQYFSTDVFAFSETICRGVTFLKERFIELTFFKLSEHHPAKAVDIYLILSIKSDE